MTGRPSFSVVISSYNQRSRLMQAIESVQRQTVPAHEVIVVDDGSEDGTAAAVRDRYPSVTVIQQENSGKGIARNRGALRATGDWVCFLDHDDLWHPEKIEILAAHIKHQPETIAIDHWVWIFREGGSAPEHPWSLLVDFTARSFDEALEQMKKLGTPRNDFSFLGSPMRTYDQSLRRIFSTTSALSMRRDVFFIAGGFPPALANGEDWTLSVNVSRLGRWHTIPRGLSCQRAVPGSGTEDPAAGLMILASLAAHWYGGRPLTTHTRGMSFGDQLAAASSAYTNLAQDVIWGAIRRGNVSVAARSFFFSMLLLPGLAQRMYAFAPPPLTWRLERAFPWIRRVTRR